MIESIPADVIRGALVRKFVEVGTPTEAAVVTTEALVRASLIGIDSHGVRLFGHYIDEITRGRIVPSNKADFSEQGSTVSCDAKWSLSHYAARLTLQKLGRLAKSFGISIGTITHSDHIGALGIHALNAQLGDLVVLAFSNANALALAPTGDRSLFGTNPFSLVTGWGDNLVYIDASSTQFTLNRVKMFAELKRQLPRGVARDSDFSPTTDPSAARYLEPLGGHKGFALAYLVEIMTSGITNSPHSYEIPDMYSEGAGEVRQLSHTFIAIDPVFFGLSAASQGAGSRTVEVVGSEYLEHLPGRRESSMEAERIKNGIPVSGDVLKKWDELGGTP